MTNADSASAKAALMQLEPYIFFYGRCEEALEFYKAALGGTYDLQRKGDSPMGDSVPEAFRSKVMHATFAAPGISFMASDGRGPREIDPEAGNISLALSAGDRAHGERIYAALSAGGNVKMPLGDAPWGDGRFAVFNDRFGLEWMLTSP
jgi:PhnB protein